MVPAEARHSFFLVALCRVGAMHRKDPNRRHHLFIALRPDSIDADDYEEVIYAAERHGVEVYKIESQDNSDSTSLISPRMIAHLQHLDDPDNK
jgi:hypothetical protein